MAAAGSGALSESVLSHTASPNLGRGVFRLDSDSDPGAGLGGGFDFEAKAHGKVARGAQHLGSDFLVHAFL